MTEANLNQILLFTAAALVFGPLLLGLSLLMQRIFAIGRTSALKSQAYECGVRPLSDFSSQFGIKYYRFALLFIVFDVEFIFLLPWALYYASDAAKRWFLFAEVSFFLALLAVGLWYAARTKALAWDD